MRNPKMLKVGSYDGKMPEMMDMVFLACEGFNERTHHQPSGKVEI